MLNTPVLFLIFNRPDTTAKVFEAIRQAKPKQLFIAADGPRANRPEEAERCKRVREIVSKIDWSCDVKTLFRDNNLGCKYAVSSAIDWFFENVEEGIILEDDTLSHESFFTYCEQLLAYYRADEKVMHISGFNFQGNNNITDSSYYFSKYPHIWGWATWKRAWKYYNVDLTDWTTISKKNKLKAKFANHKEYKYWESVFEAIYLSQLNTWDIQWLFTIWVNDGLSITPNKNLVANIGLGLSEATHTNNSHPLLSNIPLFAADTLLLHPETKCINTSIDNLLFESIFFPWRKSFSLKKILHDHVYKHLPDQFKNRYRNLKRSL